MYRPSTPAAITDHSHSSSKPPQSAPPSTKNEKSGTPTLNVDYTVRWSGRKVIKPAHLAADIGNSGSNGEKHSNNYDSNTTFDAAGGSANEDNKNYYEYAAALPNLIEQSDLAKIEDTVKDLDELTIIPKNMENLDEQDLKKYVLASQAKVKCDAHIAVVHLAANEFCIKKRLKPLI
uniref:Uncharacterized protein n=1 Tax=Panagrolaimus sp. PS1159 TaxID=55785 RepID=A0AC35GEM3_9BILA